MSSLLTAPVDPTLDFLNEEEGAKTSRDWTKIARELAAEFRATFVQREKNRMVSGSSTQGKNTP